MAKSEMLTWRVSPDFKRLLAETAHEEGTSIASLLERIVMDWFRRRQDDEADGRQRGLRESAEACFGSIAGGDPERSIRVRETLRAKLSDRRRKRSS